MRALLVDALGTLVRLEAPVPRLRAELERRFGIALSQEQAAEGLDAEIAYYRAHLDEGRDRDSLAVLRARCAEALRAALPPREELLAVSNAELQGALLAALQFSAYDDARPALSRLREQGLQIVVVSNWDVSLHEVLERLGLRELLDGIVTSAQAQARKPAPEIFRAALGLVSCAPSDARHVGDSFEEDVEGALSAGIEPVLLDRGGAPHRPGVRTIASLLELDS